MVIQSLDRFVPVIRAARTAVVCGHTNPDGDCIGSVFALTYALRAMGIETTPLFADNASLLGCFSFLDDSRDILTPIQYVVRHGAPPDLFIAIDVPNASRLADAEDIFKESKKRLGIDHHPDTVDYADLTLSDPTASAAGIIAWNLIGLLGVQRDASMAMACYVALMTDTGRFQFQNTDARSFTCAAELTQAGVDPSVASREVYQNRTLASLKLEELVLNRLMFAQDGKVVYSWVSSEDLERLGATKDDTEGLSDVLRSIAGVEVALIMRKQKEAIRGSLRAKTDRDVGFVARALGGGGHTAAAGFTYEGTIDECVAIVLALLGVK